MLGQILLLEASALAMILYFLLNKPKSQMERISKKLAIVATTIIAVVTGLAFIL